jgi:hypothetical protein
MNSVIPASEVPHSTGMAEKVRNTAG